MGPGEVVVVVTVTGATTGCIHMEIALDTVWRQLFTLVHLVDSAETRREREEEEIH